jgi:glyoxylase-like metal-dependent hydrolase (beta-lactamase superfamily II)
MIPLEDNVGDIIGKAQRGMGITNEVLREQAGITAAQLRALKGEQPPEDALRKVAPILRLGADQLVAIARGDWQPVPVPPIPGFAMLYLPFEDMTVNTYLVWDTATRRAIVFDSGPDASAVLAVVKQESLAVELVLITHAHIDHVIALPEILKATGARAWINARENAEEDFPQQVETFATGQSFVLGALRIETRLTSGHSAGQTTFVVKGLERPLAVIGDSLFAGSMGGGLVSYRDQYRNNLEQILALPDDTVLAPGHGPLTTVGEEKKHNPFFTGG